RGGREVEARALGDGPDVLVAAPGKVHEQHLVARQRGRETGGIRQGMRRFERRDDPLDATAFVECRERLVVGDGDVLRATRVLQPGVLRTNAWIIETRRDGMRLRDLAIRVLQEV